MDQTRAPRLLAALLLLWAGVVACGESREADPVAPILLVGMDGLDWSVLRSLMDDGECPNMRGLMEEGSFGRLATFTPTLSPAIWNTIATGKHPKRHGIESFLDSQNRVFTSDRRACRALWNIADRYGLTSQVFGWWTTWPVEEIRGLMVSGSSSGALVNANWKPTLLPDLPGQVHPSARTDEILDLVSQVGQAERIEALAREQIFGVIPDQHLGIVEKEILIPETLWSIQADQTYYAVAHEVLRHDLADLNMVYFGGTDVSAHRFWRYYEPDVFEWPDNPQVDRLVAEQLKSLFPATSVETVRELVATTEGDRALSEVVPNYYRLMDNMLGGLLEVVGEGVTVIIVSDHGFHASSTQTPNAKFITGHHQDAPPGVIIAAGPGIARQGNVEEFLETGRLPSRGTVFHVAPTVLALLGIPPDKEMKHGVYRALLADEVAERGAMKPIESHDEGFRSAEVRPMPEEMDEAFRRAMGQLGYLDMEVEEGADVQLVDPETFEADIKFSVDGGGEGS
ncbi:MAG: alkaline phosphatase family protein [Planctomycetota bacterium]|nr:alkaline phosphatase family protein [Planctomycetota bacterium]